jgi:zinc D-Ala-D-Ala carboxypeptidase
VLPVPARLILPCLAAVFASVVVPAASATGRAVVPEFSLTRGDLAAMIKDQPSTVQERILAAPDRFLSLLAVVLAEPADLFVLVDKSHALAANAVPADLVSLNGTGLKVTRNDLSLRKVLMPALQDMARAAAAAGVPLTIGSSYRSYEYQAQVYATEVKLYGKEQADRESARPGLSQHQLGTALDFAPIGDAFGATAQAAWLAAHAEEFGFSLSYPDGYETVTGYRHESWHYRYVTKPGASLQESFFLDIQQYMMEFLHAHRAELEKRRTGKR